MVAVVSGQGWPRNSVQVNLVVLSPFLSNSPLLKALALCKVAANCSQDCVCPGSNVAGERKLNPLVLEQKSPQLGIIGLIGLNQPCRRLDVCVFQKLPHKWDSGPYRKGPREPSHPLSAGSGCKEKSAPCSPKEDPPQSPAMLVPWSQASSFQNCEKKCH